MNARRVRVDDHLGDYVAVVVRVFAPDSVLVVIDPGGEITFRADLDLEAGQVPRRESAMRKQTVLVVAEEVVVVAQGVGVRLSVDFRINRQTEMQPRKDQMPGPVVGQPSAVAQGCVTEVHSRIVVVDHDLGRYVVDYHRGNAGGDAGGFCLEDSQQEGFVVLDFGVSVDDQGDRFRNLRLSLPGHHQPVDLAVGVSPDHQVIAQFWVPVFVREVLGDVLRNGIRPKFGVHDLPIVPQALGLPNNLLAVDLGITIVHRGIGGKVGRHARRYVVDKDVPVLVVRRGVNVKAFPDDVVAGNLRPVVVISI